MPEFPTPEPIAATIELYVGDARVTASDRSNTVVEVRPTDPAKAADVEAARSTRVDLVDGRLQVVTPKQWRRFTPFDRGGSIDVEIELPTGSRVEFDSALGDFRGEGELGACRLKTAMGTIRLDHTAGLHAKTSFGNITVDHAVGDIDVTSGSGQIRIGAVRGSALVKNSNGATSIDDVTGDVRVRSANGEIEVGRAGASVTAKTSTGDVRVGELARGVAELRTSAGDISVGVRPGTAAWLDVTSQYGRVRTELDSADAPESSDETVELLARTAVGDIDIHRSTVDTTVGPD